MFSIFFPSNVFRRWLCLIAKSFQAYPRIREKEWPPATIFVSGQKNVYPIGQKYDWICTLEALRTRISTLTFHNHPWNSIPKGKLMRSRHISIKVIYIQDPHRICEGCQWNMHLIGFVHKWIISCNHLSPSTPEVHHQLLWIIPPSHGM